MRVVVVGLAWGVAFGCGKPAEQGRPTPPAAEVGATARAKGKAGEDGPGAKKPRPDEPAVDVGELIWHFRQDAAADAKYGGRLVRAKGRVTKIRGGDGWCPTVTLPFHLGNGVPCEVEVTPSEADRDNFRKLRERDEVVVIGRYESVWNTPHNTKQGMLDLRDAVIVSHRKEGE